jgi:hypothetical protein
MDSVTGQAQQVVEHRTALILELIEKEGVIALYQQQMMKMKTRMDQLEKKCKKQDRLIVKKERQEVMDLVGKCSEDDK